MNRISQFCLSSVLAFGLCACAHYTNTISSQTIGAENIEIVAELDMRPGNVMATTDGRIFATIHPMGGNFDVQLVEIKEGKAIAWPTMDIQMKSGNYSDDVFDSPLGITKDNQGGLWVVDSGLRLGKSRVWGFDIANGDLIAKLDIPIEVAPKGSLAQDLSVDRTNGWVYIAATFSQTIIAMNIKTDEVRAFSGHPSLAADEGARLIFDGKELHFFGNPARVGLNPITMSADRETIFYGPMTGTSWYSVPAKLFRDGADDETIKAAIKRVGDKPISDGAGTDVAGNHYFTNLMENGIDMLDTKGNLTPLVRDPRFDWPDNVQTGEPNTLYIAVNQLNKVSSATGGKDLGSPPYYIFRVTLPTHLTN